MKKNLRYYIAFGIIIIILIFLVVITNTKLMNNIGFKDGSPYTASVAQIPFTLFDGDANPAPSPSCYEYATQEQGTGVNGSTSLKLIPDKWHAPVLKVYCMNNPRKDLGAYENFTFMIRSATATTDPLNVSFWTFAGPNGYANSKTVSINEYIQGGSIGTDWKQVTIPISALKISWQGRYKNISEKLSLCSSYKVCNTARVPYLRNAF